VVAWWTTCVGTTFAQKTRRAWSNHREPPPGIHARPAKSPGQQACATTSQLATTTAGRWLVLQVKLSDANRRRVTELSYASFATTA
jgi:hypothetical protein